MIKCKLNLNLRNKNKVINQSDIIVTLTSFGSRCNKRLAICLESLATQSIRPLAINCYLTYDDINNLCSDLIKLKSKYKFIYFIETDDYRSHKKYLPLLNSGYKGWFVTADDDIYYPENWLESLSQSKSKKYVAAVRCHRITFTDSKPNHYIDWQYCINDSTTTDPNVFGTSGAGILFHTDYFKSINLNFDYISKHFLRCDDVYLYFAIRRNNLCYKKIILKNLVELFDPELEALNLNKFNMQPESHNDYSIKYIFSNNLISRQ